MSIFDLHQLVIDEYSEHVQSFLSIANDNQLRHQISHGLWWRGNWRGRESTWGSLSL